MDYVILDLEWNTAYSKAKHCFVNEIIEFGAVRLDDNMEVTDSFSSFVRPQIGKKLTGRVKNLTSIQNEDVADADNYQQVRSKFTKWIGDPQKVVIMSWGDMDIRTLIDNNRYFYHDPDIPFVKYYVDLQSYFMQEKGLPKARQVSLSNAAELVEADPDEFTHHRALGDSELSAVCFKKVYNEDTFRDAVRDCDSDFYKQLLFKPYFVCDMKDKAVDKSMLSCQCPDCGVKAQQFGRWKISGNAFNGNFYCPECRAEYKVKVQFKRLYNQVASRKQITKVRPKEGKK